MIKNLSAKHNFAVIPWNFTVNVFDNSPFNYGWYTLILQTPNIFESSVHFIYTFLWLKSRMWLLYLSLNEVSAEVRYFFMPIVSFVSNLSFVTDVGRKAFVV